MIAGHFDHCTVLVVTDKEALRKDIPTEWNHGFFHQTVIWRMIIPFALMICHLLDSVAKLFTWWSREDLGIGSAHIERLRVVDPVNWREEI